MRGTAHDRAAGKSSPPEVQEVALQVAEGLQLSGEQRQSITGLWRGFNERIERILAVRQSIHTVITSSMPDGIMGRDFARNFLKVLWSQCLSPPCTSSL